MSENENIRESAAKEPDSSVPDDVLKQYKIAYTEKELKECISFS